MNPYVLLWAEANSIDLAILENRGEVARVDLNLPWTVAYSLWIQKQWRTWANSLGYEGSFPHEKAMRNGHTREEFSAWLESAVKIVTA